MLWTTEPGYEPRLAGSLRNRRAPGVPADRLMERLAAKENLLRALPDLARRHDVPDSVVQNAIIRNKEIADGVAKLRNVPSNR